MADTPSGFTVTDRRKFTLDGELRDDDSPASEAGAAPPSPPAAAPVSAPPQPAAAAGAPQEPAREAASGLLDEDPGGEDYLDDELPAVSAQEASTQDAAYRSSSDQIDAMLAEANPGAPRAATEMNFDKLVQSIYMTAALQLGAGTPANEQPRIDILGARQSIDMLNVLTEKTKGNLTDKEQRLLQNALFELRMTFLEITNAISSSAHAGAKPGKAR